MHNNERHNRQLQQSGLFAKRIDYKTHMTLATLSAIVL